MIFQISYNPFDELYDDLGRNFSTVGFVVTLQRRSDAYLLQTYVPSSLFVIISWIARAVIHGNPPPPKSGSNGTEP